ncbi:PREDICTED: uncharacterized protein LOC104738092 [Camelina sativa]|uniref:Uncharacterized protein LOC104738092 n=1 Tax=Camelina sativa TaxID=90675 RepID=A0ABM0VIC6_CAMSA|nr:PREDICTED: uncharacterized protein LOC104738092 [Camelina sativa]
MASQPKYCTVPEIEKGYPVPPSSASPPPRGWWSRPIVTLPATKDRKATCIDTTVRLSPCFGGIFTVIAVMVYLFYFLNNAHCNAKFTIQSIAVSPSSATWHVDFLVKNPSSRYTILYGVNETAVKLGPLHAAVLNTSRERKSPSHTAFSVDFVAEGNSTDVIFEQLDIKLRANHNIFGDNPEPGHIDIRCYNLTRNHENVEKVQCYSSFTALELFADSVSVSNTNVSAADWTMGLVATSPVTDCKFSLHTLKSRLLRGDQVISNSSSPSEIFGEFGSGNKPNIVFEKVVMPEVTGDVVWDYRVETWFAVNTRFTYGNGFLMATCSDISVKFTGNTTGNVTGSLLGNRRRCDYIFQEMLA